MNELSFEVWYDLNETEINIELAETGADREMDFDPEMEFNKRYEEYLKTRIMDKNEMPKYQSHKTVWALKIEAIVFDADLARLENRETDGSATIIPEEEGYGSFKVDQFYCKRHNPKVGGYYVLYEGGYESWSPAEAFENGYTQITHGEQ